jgi:ankyrin repeat protein
MNVDNSNIKNRIIELGAEDIQPAIVNACKNDKLDVIRKFHSQNLSLTVRIDDYGSTVACQAAAHGAANILQFCMDHSTDLGQDFASATPMHYACHFQHKKLIKSLIDFNVNINATDSHGESPLLCAATTGSVEVCRLLINAGANVDLVDDKGTSPLMRAAVYGHSEICDMLIDSGCDVTKVDRDYNNAANMAKRQGHTILAKKLNYLIFDSQQHFE